MRLVTPPASNWLDFRSVRHAYDEVAEDYATYLPDTRPETRLDLTMIEAVNGQRDFPLGGQLISLLADT